MFAQVPEVAAFIRAACSAARTDGWRAIEFGAYIMHDHDPRPIARSLGCAEYKGIDWRPGPGVDYAAMNREAPDLAGRDFNLSLSLQALEHDPDWRATVRAMVDVLVDGGVLAVSVPAPGWPEHETATAPGGGSYYENRTPEDITAEIAATGRPHTIIKSAVEPSAVRGRSRSLVIVKVGPTPT